MDTQQHYRHYLANSPASSPTVRVASRSQRYFSAEPSTPDHSHPIKPTSQRRSTKNTTTKTYTDASRGSTSPSSIQHDTPQRTNDSTGSTPLVNPTSSFLKGLINEQRASRSGRRAASEHPSDIHVQTPTTAPSQDDSSSEKQRKVNTILSAGLKQPREMAMREMDQYVSKLNKLNFDLKLEIYHRSQQLISLEKRLERMETLEEEVQRLQGVEAELQELRKVEESNQRLRDSNEHLRLELDKRDQAVNEAVELICQLEAKIDALETTTHDDDDGDDDGRPLTARPHTSEGLVASPSMTPKGAPIFDIPDRTSSWKGTSSARSLRSHMEAGVTSARMARRHPSFLQESSGSTSALRSLYLTADEEPALQNGFNTDSQTGSFLSGDEPSEPESPRLSILSECSYLRPLATPSKQVEIESADNGALPRSFSQPISKLDLKQEEEKDVKMSQIDQWIQPQDGLLVPAGQKRHNNYFQAQTSETRLKKRQPSLGTAFQAHRPAKPYKFTTSKLDGQLFNGGRLPPTPDTMSTSNADAMNRSNSSIIAEKSLLDQGRSFSNFSGGNISLRRPRSADDITTRPSTANTALSGTMETLTNATQLGINPGRDHLGSMFPAFGGHVPGRLEPAELFLNGDLSRQDSQEYAGESTTTNINTTTPEDSSGGNTPSARRKRYSPSLTSTHSEPQCEASSSSSPPLTPQDWLEAALPADGGKHRNPLKVSRQHPHQHRRSHSTNTKESSLLSTGDPATPTSTTETTPSGKEKAVSKPDELYLPSPTNLRSRITGIKKNQLQTENADLPRRRLSIRPRFFSRAVTAAAAASHRQTNPDSVDDLDGAPSPKIGRSRRMSSSRRKSLHIELPLPSRVRADLGLGGNGGSSGSGGEGSSHSNNNAQNGATDIWTSPASMMSTPGNGATDNRPYTSGNPETASKRRPSSFGIFGWMRGTTSSSTTPTQTQGKENNNRNSRSFTPARDTPTSTASRTTVSATASPTTTMTYSAQSRPKSQSRKAIDRPATSYTPITVNDRQANTNTNNKKINNIHTNTNTPLNTAIASSAPTTRADDCGLEKRGSRFSHRRASWKPVV
ncbi:DUF972 superfamily domain-containing protein [Histoplasma ohiense]|nr:DUF972 superfamily domain-containing protein [Histoplasma ohiense (nom. inval.)]